VILEINAFPSISTHVRNPKKEAIYEEMLLRAMKLVELKVRNTKLKIIEGIQAKGEIDEYSAIENFDL
jgi:hypothetical protein